MEKAVAGVDLGGSSTKLGLVDRNGNVLVDSSMKTDPGDSVQDYVKALYQRIIRLKQSYKRELVLEGIGFAAPNGNALTGKIDSASNLHWGKKVPITNILSSFSNLPVVLSNDANASAMGEMLFGAAKGMKNFITVTLGTGLGSGIVLNGELVYGYEGHAGEIGHITVFYDGRECGCGRKGCLETYASGTGIVRTVREMLEQGETESELRLVPAGQLSAKKITAAAKNGDPLAREAFRFTGEILGRKLADVVAMFNPEAVILSGGLAQAGDLLVEPTRSYMEDHLLDVFRGTVNIFTTGMRLKNAAILGAAAFIWKEIDEAALI